MLTCDLFKLKFLFFTLLLGVAARLPAAAQAPDPWVITADTIDPGHYYGVSVANGQVGMVPAPAPFRLQRVVLAGAYDLRNRVSSFLTTFNQLNMDVEIDGQRLGMAQVRHFRQQLDMRRAALTTTFDYADKATISYTYYALRHLPYSVLLDVSITAKKDVALTASSLMSVSEDLHDVQTYYGGVNSPRAKVTLLSSTGKSPSGKLLLSASNSFLFSEAPGQAPEVSHGDGPNGEHRMTFQKALQAGQTYGFGVVGTASSSAQHPDPLNETERLTIFACLAGRERLLALHTQAWAQLWQSDIELTGDAQAQQDVHSMLYHLYSFVRADTDYSPSPMGLSGLGYSGHVFWDSDLWMFPVLLVLHPELAKPLVEYRFRRLALARRNAVAHGYRGAMYPWESADSGAEETPVWALTGPFEHHVSACVGLAAWQYYGATQDRAWLRTKGWPVISATADFWLSRVERNGPGHYDIKNVVASDEWAENVDNDAFTNAAARANLQAATAAARLLGRRANPDWARVARNIPILHLPGGVTQEHATYHGEGIKQADVNLLAYPLRTITDPAQIKKDLAYYETRVPTRDTPAMTQAIFALLYARLGNATQAQHFFQDAYLPNLLPPFRVIAETKGGTNPYFATGAGGVLQAVLMGFGGL
ncbi:MAG: glycoside hydrolase family 65 protein, partial [Cytophagaceae bacterium]